MASLMRIRAKDTPRLTRAWLMRRYQTYAIGNQYLRTHFFQRVPVIFKGNELLHERSSGEGILSRIIPTKETAGALTK
jgi:hypothetical protein